MNTSRADGVRAPEHRGNTRNRRRSQVEIRKKEAIEEEKIKIVKDIEDASLGVPSCCGVFT